MFREKTIQLQRRPLVNLISAIMIILLVLLVWGCNGSDNKIDRSEIKNIEALLSNLAKKYDAVIWQTTPQIELFSSSFFTIEVESLLVSTRPILLCLTLKDLFRRNGKYIAAFEHLDPYENINIIYELYCTEDQKEYLMSIHNSKIEFENWSDGYAVIALIESVYRFRLTLEAYTEDYEIIDDEMIAYIDIEPKVSPSYLAEGNLLDFEYINDLFYYIIPQN